MTPSRLRHALALALSLAVVLPAAPCTAWAQQWSFSRSSMKLLTVPRAIRELTGFGDLDYDDTSQVVGLRVDLNRDGHLDYVIRSAQSLCGNAGCDYLIVDGATRRGLGIVSGGTFYVDAAPRGRFPALHSLTSSSAFTARWTEHVVRNGKYTEGASREFDEQQLDSVMHSLKDIPSIKASGAPVSRPR